MATTFTAYFIQCITNLHVGSGDTNYGIIDKMVQRDPITGYPTIHASSLKGALREHFEQKWGKDDSRIANIFGKESNNDTETGTHRFLNADLIALPIRCTHKQYIMGLDKTLATFVNTKAKNICHKAVFNETVFGEQDSLFGASPESEIYAEDYALKGKAYTAALKTTPNLLKDSFASFQTKHFEQLVKDLPVIARNKVGENLWYEEIVPHQTIFITFMGTAKEDETFNTALTTDLIQIGANASVGYGLCKFHKITFNV